MPLQLEDVEIGHVANILAETPGPIKEAGGGAELIGINPSTVYSRMCMLGIQVAPH